MNINDIQQEIRQLLDKENIPYPNSVKEYDELVRVHLHKYHRSTLCTHGIQCSSLLKLLNPNYINGEARPQMFGFSKYQEKAKRLNLDASIENFKVTFDKFTQKDRVILKCNNCGFVETITGTSLNRRINGCKKCSGALKWESRLDILSQIALNRNLTLLEYTSSNKQVKLTCVKCGLNFTRQLNTLVNDTKYTCKCPQCHPPAVYGKQGKTAVYDEIIFDSLIELDTYKLLKESDNFNSIKVHIPYRVITAIDTEMIVLLMRRIILIIITK
jgi:hypothetical protein